MTRTSKVLLSIAGLALVPTAATAQDNVLVNDTTVANTTVADPALTPLPPSDPAVSGTTNVVADPALDPLAADPALTETTNTYTPPPEEDDNDFPWGLLGLLGLAGLMGRKKNDADIHVDNRTDRRNV